MRRHEWKAIEGYPGYEVSPLGAVRSWRCSAGYPRLAAEPHVLRPSYRGPYPTVSLLDASAKKATHAVHILVAAAFLGPRPEGMEVAHNDGDGSNCRVDNLRYATRLENEHDKWRHGTRPQGERCYNAKLTEADVKEILRLRASGVMPTPIAVAFGVRPNYVRRIVAGGAWRHVEREVA